MNILNISVAPSPNPEFGAQDLPLNSCSMGPPGAFFELHGAAEKLMFDLIWRDVLRVCVCLLIWQCYLVLFLYKYVFVILTPKLGEMIEVNLTSIVLFMG